MERHKNFFTSILLFTLLLSFITTIFVEKPANPVVITLFLLFTVTTVILITKSEFIAEIPLEKKSNFIENSLLIIASALGAITTYEIANFSQLHLGAVIASSLVGVVGWGISKLIKNKLDAKTFALCIYCGSFVGMSSVKVMPDFFIVGVAGILCGIVFIFAQSIFVGAGGKLGTIAFVGSVLTVLIFSLLGIK